MLLPIAIASVSTIAVLAAVGRAMRLRRIRQQLQRPLEGLPLELSESWSKSRVWQFASQHFVVGGTVAFSTAQALFHLNRMDGQALDAIDTIYQPGVENSFDEIVEHLRGLDSGAEAAWAGGLAAYKGRLGEEYIAESLEAAGHHVELATATNQAGWDALVDGQAVNFKAGLDTGHIEDHLARYPDIPVITVAEQGEAFADNSMVTCLTGVSGEEIEQTTEAAMESVVDATDFGLDIPMVTLAIAAAKNFKPVLGGHTDFGTATVNTAADTAGVGLGAAAGAKAGAMAGAFGGPVGVVAGSIVGGLVGAMGGRSIAKGFKEKALNKARSDYDTGVTKYGHAYATALYAKADQLNTTALSYERPLSVWRFFRPAPSDLLRKELQAAYSNWAAHCREHAKQLIEQQATRAPNDEPYHAMGDQLLQQAPKEAVYHPQIESALTRIRESVARIIAEKRRLGYTT